jgi:hypothetical protein
MITTTQTDAFRAIVDDNRLIEVALFDVVDAIVRTMINRRPTGDVLTSLNFLREQLEKGPSQ